MLTHTFYKILEILKPTNTNMSSQMFKGFQTISTRKVINDTTIKDMRTPNTLIFLRINIPGNIIFTININDRIRLISSLYISSINIRTRYSIICQSTKNNQIFTVILVSNPRRTHSRFFLKTRFTVATFSQKLLASITIIYPTLIHTHIKKAIPTVYLQEVQ